MSRVTTKKVKPQGVRQITTRPREISGVEVQHRRGKFTALGYQSIDTMIRDGRTPPNGSGDHFLEYSRPQLVAQARDFQRNNSLFDGLIDTTVGYLVGDGFKLQASTDKPEFNVEVERIWKEFWSGSEARPDISGVHSGFDVEEMLAREMLTTGDTGLVLTDAGKVQLIENEQIVGPGRVNASGVERKNGEVRGYWVAPWGPGGQVQTAAARLIPKASFLYCGRPRRPSAVRAAPPCQSAFPMFHRISDVCDSEAMAWDLLSRLALTVNRPGATDLVNQLGKTERTGDTSGNAAIKVLDFDYGMVIAGQAGDEIKGVDRNLPGQNFTESIRTFIRLLGRSLGVPLEIIFQDWSQSNYSQARAVLLQAYRTFIRWQRTLAERVLTPVYRWVIDRAIEEERLPAPVESFDHYNHSWVYPIWPWIDLLHEAQAYALKLDRSLCTHAQVLKSLGNDPEDFLKTTEQEVRRAIEISLQIKAEKGVDVPWQMFCGRAVSVNPAPAEAKPAAAAEEKKGSAA